MFSLSIWSFILSTFYLISILICDTLLYFFGLNNLEKFNHFIRNTFSSIVFPYCFLLSLEFLLILLLKIFFQNFEIFFLGKKGYGEYNLEMFIIDSYVLFVTTVFMLVDLFCNQRDKVEFNWCFFITYIIIYIIYIIFYHVTNIQFYNFFFYNYS